MVGIGTTPHPMQLRSRGCGARGARRHRCAGIVASRARGVPAAMAARRARRACRNGLGDVLPMPTYGTDVALHVWFELPWLCLPFPRGNGHAATPQMLIWWGRWDGQHMKMMGGSGQHK
eukprot:gene22181-biopygen8724